MNKNYRLIWSELSNSWVAVSEITRGRGKATTVSRKLRKLFGTGVAALALAGHAASAAPIEVTIDSVISPSVYNNRSGMIGLAGDEVNLSGNTIFNGSTYDFKRLYLTDAYRMGYASGGVDPTTVFRLDLGAASNGVAVSDPIGGGSTTINTYNTNSIASKAIASLPSQAIPVYGPTTGNGTYYQATLALVDLGGTLNFNVNDNGVIGTAATKDTAYVQVRDGQVNWNSKNSIYFAVIDSVVTPASVLPYSKTYDVNSYAMTPFNVTTTEGTTSHTVSDLPSLRIYNEWLIAELRAGHLGSGAVAQAQYNLLFAQAYTVSTQTYTIDPSGGKAILPTDPIFQAISTRAALLADGVNATGTITDSGEMKVYNGTGLVARNGGTVINNGTLSSPFWDARGFAISTGGHGINNGVRNVGFSNIANPAEQASYGDTVSDAGSTLMNNGVVNVGNFTATSGAVLNHWLEVLNGATGVNKGTVNVAINSSPTGKPYGVSISGVGSSFTNDVDGVIYLGREGSLSATGSPLNRGGADVAIVNGVIGIIANADATLNNSGKIIIGDKVQDGQGISVKGSGLNVVNSGEIIVNGHFNATPLNNIGIQATGASGFVGNSGKITLLGVNGIGIKADTNSQVTSSGTINVQGGMDPSTGLRNYGIWSQDAGSNVTLSGTVNLTGDGAIGVHARDSGGVTVAGAGEVKFISGTKQIGFFAYGPNATITNTGTGSQDVTTDESTLFRVEDGATFTGGSGASSALTASGKNSVAVKVTGKTGGIISTFDSGAMTIDLTGEGATGVMVEGGATGEITAAATINLDEKSAIAGIADGQKYNLAGIAVGVPDDTTSLEAGAALNSTLDSVTGYIARNKATLNNTGNIDFSGADTTGIRVEEGATGGNSGTIKINDGGIGLAASSSNASSGLTTINNTGNLILAGGTNSKRTKGIDASGSQVKVNMTSGSIDMQGQGAIGVIARDGAAVILAGTALPQFAAEATGVTDQIAFLVEGAGSTITTNVPVGTLLDASGKDSTLFRIADGAIQSGVLQMKTSGTGSTGIWATGDGTVVTTAAGSDFQVLGADARALNVNGGAHATLQAGTTVNLVGNGAIVGMVDGNEYDLDGSTVILTNTDAMLTNEANLTSNLSQATGFITQNQGQLINKGKIDFSSGTQNTGIKVLDGQFENHSDITINGVAVYVEGEHSKVNNVAGLIKATDGEAAIKLGSGASLDLGGSGVGKITAGGSAHGVLLDTGAVALKVDGAYIDMASTGAGTGNGIENKAEISGIQLTNTTKIDVKDGKGVRTSASLANTNAGTINVMGSGVGLAFETAAGGASTSNVDLSKSNGLNITVSAQGGTGIRANTTGTVNTAANVNVTHASGGSALELIGVGTATNAGKLASISTTDATVDLGKTTNFTNALAGEISSTDTAMSFDAQNSTLTNLGKIAGLIKMNEGNNTVSNSGTFSGNVTAGNGNNTVVLETGSSSQNITAGTGVNQFTVKGTASFLALDGGMGAGEDILNFDGATYTLSNAAAIQHFEKLNLINNTVFNANVVLDMTNVAGGVGKVDIASGSEFAVKNVAAGNYAFNHALTGSGVISSVLNAATNSFDFGADVGSAFTGTAKLGTGTFALSGNNTTALTNATLQVDAGNVTTVGTGNQAIGGLTFNGGKTVFNVEIPADKVATGKITTSGKLDVSGTGTVQVSIPANFANDQPLVNTKLSLLEQDDQTALVQLIDAKGTVEGTGGQLSLVDQNGVAITNAKQIDINQGTTKVAVGTYDYRANTGTNNDGLYVSYGLKEIDLQGTAANALVLAPSAGATGLATDLSAKVTGTGDLAIAAGTGKTVSLSNGGNTYSGETLAQTGTLQLAANNVLGNTSNLVISTGATVDMNGKSQSVGQINTATGGKLDLTAGSTLTIDDTQRSGGTSGGSLEANTLFGSGDFIIDPSIINVNGANTNYSGNVTVTGGSELIMNNVQGVGDVGNITLATATDKLTLGELATVAGANPNGELKKTLAGLGEVDLKNTADVILAADNSSFAGVFNLDTNTHLRASDATNLGSAAIINNGELHLLTDSDWEFINTFTGAGSLEKLGAATLTINHDLAHTGKTDVNAGTLLVGGSVGSAATLSGGGDVNVAAAAVLSGTGDITGKVNNAGTIASLNALSNHSADAISNLTVGALTNSGTVMLAGGTTGNTLTVKGGLTSNGGRVVMNTELGDDSSVTDKLILDGGTTTGNTSLVVQDKGNGKGAQTIQGIRLVETQNGATTAADAFKLDSASSGYRNGAGTLAIGAYDYSLKRGGAGGIADDWYLTSAVYVEPTPNPTPRNITPAARPEAGSYLENQRVAQNMFNMTLHDREGMRPAGQEADRGGVWARVVDTRTKSHADNDRLDTTGDSDIIQIGAELINWQGADSNIVAGVMGGYGKADSKTSSSAYDYGSKGKVTGYSSGIFGTWYQNQEMTGLYVDSWFQYGWYKNEANGDGLAQDKYNSTAWTASVEAGYALPIGETNGYQWIFEPQAQIGYTDYSADSHRDAGGTRIELQDNSGVTTRVGAKLYSRKITTGGNTVQPFIQMNWLHNQNSGQVMMNNDVVQNNVPKDIGELKIGLESTFNTNWSVWGNLGLQQGSHDYSQVSGQAGVKYSW